MKLRKRNAFERLFLSPMLFVTQYRIARRWLPRFASFKLESTLALIFIKPIPFRRVDGVKIREQ